MHHESATLEIIIVLWKWKGSPPCGCMSPLQLLEKRNCKNCSNERSFPIFLCLWTKFILFLLHNISIQIRNSLTRKHVELNGKIVFKSICHNVTTIMLVEENLLSRSKLFSFTWPQLSMILFLLLCSKLLTFLLLIVFCWSNSKILHQQGFTGNTQLQKKGGKWCAISRQ